MVFRESSLNSSLSLCALLSLFDATHIDLGSCPLGEVLQNMDLCHGLEKLENLPGEKRQFSKKEKESGT